MQLRGYQIEAKDAILKEWEEGRKRTLLVLPTGCGKTIVFSKVAEDRVNRGGRVLIIHDCTVYIIKVEEGSVPPYITNEGKIYCRLSSGSFPIKDATHLARLIEKRRDTMHMISDKIILNPIEIGRETPTNLCAYVDVGLYRMFTGRRKLYPDARLPYVGRCWKDPIRNLCVQSGRIQFQSRIY